LLLVRLGYDGPDSAVQDAPPAPAAVLQNDTGGGGGVRFAITCRFITAAGRALTRFAVANFAPSTLSRVGATATRALTGAAAISRAFTTTAARATGCAPAKPSGYSLLDGVVLDAKGNIYVSEVLRNEIWVLSPDGSHRLLIASKMNAPLDNNSSLLMKGDVLCTANFGLVHYPKIQEADRTVVCMKGFATPK
jgi:hypothetical protein